MAKSSEVGDVMWPENIIFLEIKKVPWILNSLVTPLFVMIDNYQFTLGNSKNFFENTIQVNQ